MRANLHGEGSGADFWRRATEREVERQAENENQKHQTKENKRREIHFKLTI